MKKWGGRKAIIRYRVMCRMIFLFDRELRQPLPLFIFLHPKYVFC